MWSGEGEILAGGDSLGYLGARIDSKLWFGTLFILYRSSVTALNFFTLVTIQKKMGSYKIILFVIRLLEINPIDYFLYKKFIIYYISY